MKVVQVLYSGLGGHGSVAFSLAQAARDAGRWQPAMVFMGIEPTLPAYMASCQAAGYQQIEIRAREGRPWQSWWALFRALDAMRPDAIILHSVKAILPAALYAWRRSIPLVAVEHQPNALKSKAEWLVSRWLQRLAGAIVVLTEDYRATLEAAIYPHWRADKVHLIPNGIDVRRFAPATKREAGAVRTIGMAARMTTMKRQELLIDALALLVAEGSDDWRLSLAGDGETLPSLRERAERLDVQALVEFTGYLDEPALVDWFNHIDVYSHASNGETLSTSLLQALAMGLPIVGSDVPGISDLLASGHGAGVVASQSPEAFEGAFRELVRDPAHEQRLRSRARRLAETEYSQQVMFERYDRLLESLCPR
jgi:glycosyltransferase involved in cell wall biosynthesis